MTLTTRTGELVNFVEDRHGIVVAVFDLRSLDIDPTVAAALLRAHAREFGHNSLETQRQAFRCLRKLILCLQELGLHRSKTLPQDLPIRVHQWLGNTGLKGSTAQSHQAIIITLLRWSQRNVSIISGQPNFIVPAFIRNVPKVSEKLTAEEQDSILRVCFEAIQNNEEILELFWEDVRSATDDQGNDPAGAVAALLEVGNGRIPEQKRIDRLGGGLSRKVTAIGGSILIRSCLYLTYESLIPYYLAILILTAGNPHALRNLRVDCIRQHPLRTDLESLTWDKPRSGREQRVDFPVGRTWSAPGLVRRLQRVTAPLRMHASPADREKLFIAMSARNGNVGIPSVQSMHNMLATFIHRHGLRNFDFKDCRPSVASRLYAESASMERVRRLLNHRSSRTSSRYVNPEDLSKKNDRAIEGFQGQLIRGTADGGNKAVQTRVGDAASQTVFGFVCTDPYGGLNSMSQKGKLCTHFSGCATCPGALIPVDDVGVVSRILSARKAMLAAREAALTQGWWVRFSQQYQPTLDVIEKEIIPLIDIEVLDLAAGRVAAQTIPSLE